MHCKLYRAQGPGVMITKTFKQLSLNGRIKSFGKFLLQVVKFHSTPQNMLVFVLAVQHLLWVWMCVWMSSYNWLASQPVWISISYLDNWPSRCLDWDAEYYGLSARKRDMIKSQGFAAQTARMRILQLLFWGMQLNHWSIGKTKIMQCSNKNGNFLLY